MSNPTVIILVAIAAPLLAQIAFLIIQSQCHVRALGGRRGWTLEWRPALVTSGYVREALLRQSQRHQRLLGSPKMNLRPNRSCCPVPLHLGQTWCARLATHPFIFGLFLQFEHKTQGLSLSDNT
jgi:hypothetical protein